MGGILEALGTLVGTFGFTALFAGALMFLPTAALKRRRRTAKGLLFGGIAAAIVGAVLTPVPPSGAAAEPEVASKVEPASPEPKSTPTPDRSAAKEEFVTLYRSVLSSAKPCDMAIERFGKIAASGAGDMVSAYVSAKRGFEACQQSTMSIGSLQSPDGLGSEAEEAVSKALKTCEEAYSLRQIAMRTAMKVTDGDGRPSVVASFSDEMKSAQGGVMLCLAQFLEAGSVAGIDTQRLS